MLGTIGTRTYNTIQGHSQHLPSRNEIELKKFGPNKPRYRTARPTRSTHKQVMMSRTLNCVFSVRKMIPAVSNECEKFDIVF